MDVGALHQKADRVGLNVRELVSGDRDRVREILIACAVFTDEEVSVAMQVLDEGLAGGLEGDYPLFGVESDGELVGYVCIGKTPLTANTWHLYWICVDPGRQRFGVGKLLQSHVEEFIRSRGGERLVLETSSQPIYERTRAFYRCAGYSQVGRIKNFYKRGDDCVIFCKRL